MIGLLFVIFGVWIYNDIIIMPFIRHNNKNGFIRHAMRTPERKISQEPIIGSEENAGRKIPKIIDPMKTKKQAFYTLNIPK